MVLAQFAYLERGGGSGQASSESPRALWETRTGSVNLKIPKLRKGGYFPGFLEPHRTAGKALAVAVQEAHI